MDWYPENRPTFYNIARLLNEYKFPCSIYHLPKDLRQSGRSCTIGSAALRITHQPSNTFYRIPYLKFGKTSNEDYREQWFVHQDYIRRFIHMDDNKDGKVSAWEFVRYCKGSYVGENDLCSQ